MAPSPRKKAKVTGRHKSHGEGESSKTRSTKGKVPASMVDKASTPRSRRPKSVGELCSAQLGVDSRDYHVVQMSNLPERNPDSPLEMHLSPLTYGTRIWQDRVASAKYTCEFLSLQSQHYYMALVNRVHDVGWVISAMDSKVDGLRKEIQELKASSGSEAVTAAEQWASEAQSLVEHYKTELEEVTCQQESLELELNDSQN
ncbi:hypothetical protein B296_00028189 [Ensete ventricosum]|uniref:Uncharacterized protein n=1 Tax=Ensete ventricosum TaxID=4639 RepID=A0A426Z9W0_ENSVE|nr:hypothetical protein B296_00028189 [Ensete ventricosum]